MEFTNTDKRRIMRRIGVIFPLIFICIISLSCTNSLDNNKGSSNPIGTAIIAVQPNPSVIYGNGCSESFINVVTEIVGNGTPIEFEITSTGGLPPSLAGCLFNATPTVENGSAFVNYLAGILKGIGTTANPVAATINISATVKPPGGDVESRFGSVTLLGVGIVPPESPIEVAVPFEPDAPLSKFITLSFGTVGIKPGTIALVNISNPNLGVLSVGGEIPEEEGEPVQTVVQGSVDSGSFTVQYFAFAGAGGTQVVTAIIDLTIPPEFLGICPIPSPQDLRIEATIIINQTVEEPMEEMMP